MSFLVDTNVLSELRKGSRCAANVAAWFARASDDELHTSVLVVGELRNGIERLRRRDGARAAALDAWLRTLASQFGSRVLSVDGRVAEEWGRLAAIRTLSVVDGLLAATAIVNNLVLVTRNVRDVRHTGVRVLDPFAAAPS